MTTTEGDSLRTSTEDKVEEPFELTDKETEGTIIREKEVVGPDGNTQATMEEGTKKEDKPLKQSSDCHHFE